MQQTIPVVDLDEYLAGGALRERFVSKMGNALKDIGFFALQNHGVDHSLIEKAYQLSADFFDLQVEVKRKYEVVELKGQRGFTSFGREQAKGAKVPDLKEFWHVGRELPDDHPLNKEYHPNFWPIEVRDFKATMVELYRQLDLCSLRLLEACSLYVGEQPDLLPSMATDGNTILRIINYPEVASDRDPAAIRAGAHEDINFITLLCEATAGGLELLQRDGSWLPIHALKGQIIVDTGDMLQNLTNGLLRSTTHRVVNPDNSRERRFSMPFFVHPRSEVKLNPLPKCVNRMGGKKSYPDILAGAYLDQRLKEIGLGKPARSAP
ncbi:MAG TPA: 2-oxoglutarate and iron-dependent oxygenase domain-containing protein [Bdellovibrionota bacterium]|jgi:isopenicillin N synthase-like dioxygenase